MKLGDVCEFVRGPFGGSLKKDIFKLSGYAVYEQQHAIYNQFDEIRYFIDETKFNEMKRFELRPGDLIMSCSGTMGKVSIVPENIKKGIINQALLKLRPKKELNNNFLKLWLQSNSFQEKLNSYSQGATIKNVVSVDILKKIDIPLPSLTEQKHIAEVLSKAEVLIAERKQSIQLLDEYLKSTFLEMFGDIKGIKTSLSEICEVNPKKSEIAGLSKETVVSFIPMASVSENGLVDLSQTKKIDEVWSGFTYFREDDVTFAKITPCMENGKGAIMRGLKNKIGFGTTEFHVLRPIEKLSTSEYIYHLTMQHNFRKEAEKNMTGSAGQKRVPTDFFKKYKLVAPPLKLQTQFAAIVEKTEALKAQYKEHLQSLEQMYGALSQRAFRGEQTPIVKTKVQV